MPALLYTERALADLTRRVDFLLETDAAAAEPTAALVRQALEMLEAHPLLGRPVEGDLRELVISRGHTGYIALYEYKAALDRVVVHAVRHQREAGFEE